MSATQFDEAAAKKANIELITDAEKGRQAVHDVVVAMQANRRRGTASTKTKAEVALSGAKPWRQKGTGRARAGYKSSTIWRGGGVVFGPKPRDYSKHVPTKVRVLAFRKALSERVLSGDVLHVDSFSIPEGKTKKFLEVLGSQVKDARKVLLIGSGFDEATCRAARNVQHVQLARAQDVNTEQLLAFDKILITEDALTPLSERLAK